MITYKKQHESGFLFYWCLFVLSIIIIDNMIETLFISSVYSELPKIAAGIAIFVLFYGVIKWIRSYYLTKWPFKLKFLKQRNLVSIKQNFLTNKITIKVIVDSKFPELAASKYPKIVEFKISPRKKLIFEQLGFKLEKKRWYWGNEPRDIVNVKEIEDINIENEQRQVNKTHIADMRKAIKPRDNIKTFTSTDGWTIGQYPVPETCPKGSSLLLKVKLYIVIKRKWKGYINFKHIRGDDYQGCARLPIEFCRVKLPNSLKHS